MKRIFLVLPWCVVTALRASNLDTIGVTVLRQVDSTLQGSGVPVAQVEAPVSTNLPPPFEVTPANAGQPAGLFTYLSSSGTATNFPNSAGADSWHADGVANNFYGTPNGVAPAIAHVTNYEANYFYNNIIKPLVPNPPAIAARVANQSFIFDQITTNAQATIEQSYDNYAAQYGTLFVSGVGNGNGTPVSAPATCYNGIGVAVSDGSSSVGPAYDGRCKPDLTAPGGATSFSTPYVAGSAAVLIQAATRGDGGASPAEAGDLRTVKALLLNGAVKPADWTNGPATPLDARYGAGIVNVFNSWKQLSDGRHSFIESTTFSNGSLHPPGASTNNEPALAGWDFNAITNTRVVLTYQDQANHYYFNLPAGGGDFTFTSTLVWNRQNGQTAINNLNLFLYRAADSNLVACSTSLVDNVEHIFLPALPPGRYDLQVEKTPLGVVSASETYALAFEFFKVKLNLALTNGLALITWPAAPTGFILQSAPGLTPPVAWTDVNAVVSVSNGVSAVSLPVTATNQFFRLQRP